MEIWNVELDVLHYMDLYMVVQTKQSFACLYLSAGEYSAIDIIMYPVKYLVKSPANVPAFIEAVKKREKVLSGFGHRSVSLLCSNCVYVF